MQVFSEITIRDKQKFESYFKKYNPEASELTFTNLFMWRGYYKIKYAEFNGYLCIISEIIEGKPFAFAPIGIYSKEAFTETINFIKGYFTDKGWEPIFKRVTQNEISYFQDALPNSVRVESERDNFDYVYSSEDLIKLSGKKYDGKRNHINKFKKLYDYEYVEIDENNISECFKIMDAWCAERECDEHRGFYCEKLANTELLNNYFDIGCKGALIKIDGKYEAFTVGEMLNEQTAVIHIEKGNSKVNGIYTFINQKFCENTWHEAQYINREQDLGVEGLRKAKLSYHPVKLLEKFMVVLE